MKKYFPQALIFFAMVLAISFFQTRNHISFSQKAPPLTGQSKTSEMVNKDFTLKPEASIRPTLLYFFAPWCGVCKVSMGNINFISSLSSANIILVALDYDSTSEVIDLVADKGLNDFELILGDSATNQAYKINAYPTYYVVSANGDIVTSSVGYSTTFGMLIRLWMALAVG